jgi:hypothetical protein
VKLFPKQKGYYVSTSTVKRSLILAEQAANEGVRLSEAAVNTFKKTGHEDEAEFDLVPLKVE